MKNSIFLIGLLFSVSAFADVAIIVHPSNNSAIDADAVGRIFLGRDKSFADGQQAIPVSLPETEAATTEFNDKILNRSSSQLKAYWSKLVFTGKGSPPKEMSNEAEMIKLIATNPSLIGYVSADKVDSSVKVVLTK